MGLFSEAYTAATPQPATKITPKATMPPATPSGGLFSQTFSPAKTSTSALASTKIQPIKIATPSAPKAAPIVANPSPNPEASLTPEIPAKALEGNLGGGYGQSNIKDQYSGKPLLTFENPVAKSSQLLENRVAPNFDPTVPQKIDPSVLHNGRMPEAASAAVKKATGAAPDTQLDHLISLEVGGSNDTSNLNNENLKSDGTQFSLTTENQIAKDVATGKISYVEGQKEIARAKGVQLPDDTAFSSSDHPLAQYYAKAAPNQVGTQEQNPSLLTRVKNAVTGAASTVKNDVEGASKAFVSTMQNGGQTFKDSVLSYLAGVPISTKDESGAFKINLTDGQIQQISDTANAKAAKDLATAGYSPDQIKQIQSTPMPSTGDPIKDLPKNILQGATRSALAYGESLVGEDTPLQPGAISQSKLGSIAQLAIYGNQPVAPFASQSTIGAAKAGNLPALGKVGLAGLGLGASVTLDPGTWDDDTLLKLANETDHTNIADILIKKGIDEDAAHTLAPIISQAKTPEAVKSVLQFAADKGFIYGAKEEGTNAADEFAQQEAGKGGSASAEEPKALTAGGEKETVPAVRQTVSMDDVKKEAAQYPNANNFAMVANKKYGISTDQATEIYNQAKGENVTGAVNGIENNDKPTIPDNGKVTDIPASEQAPEKSDNIPTIKTDEQAQNEAATKAYVNSDHPHVDPINNLDKDTQGIYRDWVNTTGDSNKVITGKIASKPFEPLRDKGMAAVHAFQSGDRSGQLEAVDKWGKDLIAKEQAAGIPVEPRANYLPQYWANSKSEIEAAQQKYFGENHGKNVQLRPGFSKEATFPDYATGMELGLTPKYDNIPDMINARVRASEKALGDRKFFESIAERGLIQPRAGAGWKTLDQDHFPNYAVKDSVGEIHKGAMKAPGPLADLINNQLKGPESLSDKIFEWTAKTATVFKGIVLSAGVPGTAINMHGFNELAATVPELFNQPSLFGNALKYLFHPQSGGKFVEKNLATAQEAARAGLILGGEDQTITPAAEAAVVKGPLGKAKDVFDKGRQLLYSMFAKHDFEQMIPALKLQMWSDTKEYLMAKGMNEADAARHAAERSNNTFGGLNYAALGRDKNFQNMLRSAVFAPDFWESRFRYAGGMGKSVVGKGPSKGLYQKAVAAVIAAYVGLNIANKKTSGKWMFENPPGHSMDVLVGKDSAGKDIWVRPFGTDLDFVRLPLDIATGISQGDSSELTTLLRDRVSTIVQPAISWFSNTDAYGNKIFGPSTAADPASAQWAAFLGQLPIVPGVGGGLTGLLNKNQSKAQSLAEALSLPVRFNSATTPAVSTVADLIYTERPALEKEIKADYLNGNTQDALTKMASYNKQLLQATIQSYEDNGYHITDQNQFTQFLLTNSQAKGGLKGLFLTPPSAKVLQTATEKNGKPLFNKIFPSTISSSTP